MLQIQIATRQSGLLVALVLLPRNGAPLRPNDPLDGASHSLLGRSILSEQPLSTVGILPVINLSNFFSRYFAFKTLVMFGHTLILKLVVLVFC